MDAGWYASTLTAISFWIAIGLIAHVRDIWRSPRCDDALAAADDRWSRRFAVTWRLGVCLLFAASFLVRFLAKWQFLTQDSCLHFLNRRLTLHGQGHKTLGQLEDFPWQLPDGGKRR
jgi:hypothetical protein